MDMYSALAILYDTALIRKSFEDSMVTTRELLGMALNMMSGISVGMEHEECPKSECSRIDFEGSRIVILCAQCQEALSDEDVEGTLQTTEDRTQQPKSEVWMNTDSEPHMIDMTCMCSEFRVA